MVLGGLLVAALLVACARSLPAPQPPAGGQEGPAPSERPLPQVAVLRDTEEPPLEPDEQEGRSAQELALPRLLRVGLATDRSAVKLACGGDRLVAEADGRVYSVTSPLRITPAAEVLKPGFYRLQVAALKDEAQAQSLSVRLEREWAAPADVVFDAGSDLYRVRVGRYPTPEAAERVAGRFARQGLGQAWVVSEKALLRSPALRLSQGERSLRVPGRWLALHVDGQAGIRFEGRRFRGRLLVYLNDRGSLNVINELPLEDYLRGVVPREMGPEVYQNLAALKAQTVAARTYTLKNLGEFLDEGYDICATPRCQVYGGMEFEHPLTDRAVAETAGEVLRFGGQLVDALYSSTCGGHTEDVRVIFPQKNEPYLQGVACLEAGVDRLAGSPGHEGQFPSALMRRFFPPKGLQTEPEVVAARLEHLALLAGLPIPEDRLASLDRREVQRFIASVFDLALDLRPLVAPGELPDPFDRPPQGWSDRDLRLAAYLRQSGLLVGELAKPPSLTQIEETLFRLAVLLRVIQKVEGRYQGLEDGRLRLRTAGETVSYDISDRLATFRRSGDRVTSGPLRLLAGDRLTLYLHDRELVAVAQESGVDGFSFDRAPGESSWTRFRSDSELAELVNARYPGLGFQGLSILSRGVSGRVGRIRIEGDGENWVEVEGLAIRWTLDLPDTLFTAKRLSSAGREPGWLFSGRGWGHGVGMCQVGAYGMGLRGHSYRDILEYYYTGIEIAKIGLAEGGPAAASLR